MHLSELSARALEIRQKYDEANQVAGRPIWQTSDFAQAFAGDVGQLLRLLMMKRNLRAAPEDIDEKLEHELCDCLWATLVIADKLGVKLEEAFPKVMADLAARIAHK